ncbi:MAG: zf-HC2 domain-containing protein, partial [Chloroflexi bacterium]|nr:zf-HC2 domain-containing protein [Chloroflexota bacterium]
MLNQGHPDDERLSALAAGDADATEDATLRAHVTSCDRCADAVRELGVLRAALADLPDIAPHRPLRLLPPVEADAPSPADRLGLWARRLFAPALT